MQFKRTLRRPKKKEKIIARSYLTSLHWTLHEKFDWGSCDGKLLQLWPQLGWIDQFGRGDWENRKQWHWRRIQASWSGQGWICEAIRVWFVPLLIQKYIFSPIKSRYSFFWVEFHYANWKCFRVYVLSPLRPLCYQCISVKSWHQSDPGYL